MRKETRFENGSYGRQRNQTDAYRDFDATELYCQRCKRAVPVRKRLLLVLPDGDKFEYMCAYCSTSVGSKVERDIRANGLIL